MTISSTINRKEYTGNGSTTSFSFPYSVLLAADLKVYQAGVLKTLTTHYTLSGTAPYTNGTNVQFLVAPASAESIVILRDPALTQLLDLLINSALPADELEKSYDLLTMLQQRLSERVDRSFHFSDTDVSGASLELPIPAALRLIGWDADGLALVNYSTLSGSILASSYIGTLLVAIDAAAARAVLGAISIDGGSIIKSLTPFILEGAVENGFETSIKLIEPTKDNDIEIPNINARIWNLPAGLGPLPFSGSSIPEGWLECNGAAVSRTTYAALFAVISTTWGAGDGSTTFNIPDMRGRSPIGVGRGTATESGVDGDVTLASERLRVPSNNKKWITGMPVVFNLTSGTITPLVSSTTYYVIRISATGIQLATTLANAQNVVSINFTAKSNPVWDITHSFQTRTLGDQGGEESHAALKTETLAHTHNVGHAQSQWIGQGSVTSNFAGNAAPTTNPQATSSVGGNKAANIMQPFAVTKYIISY